MSKASDALLVVAPFADACSVNPKPSAPKVKLNVAMPFLAVAVLP